MRSWRQSDGRWGGLCDGVQGVALHGGFGMIGVMLALLLYPGLGLAVVLALLFGWVSGGTLVVGRPRAVQLGMDSLAGLLSIALTTLALALLPWPLHPAAGSGWLAEGSPLALWVAIEGACLVPLLPGLLAPSPFAARAASREAQIGFAGRCVLWFALGIALWSGMGWRSVEFPGRVLALLAGLLAFPAAAGIGPFGPERSLSAAGMEEGLDEVTAGLMRFARGVRGAALLAMLLVASVSLPVLEPWVLLTLDVALFVVVTLLVRRIVAGLPRLPLPNALRWCWWRALPLAVAALVYTIII